MEGEAMALRGIMAEEVVAAEAAAMEAVQLVVGVEAMTSVNISHHLNIP